MAHAEQTMVPGQAEVSMNVYLPQPSIALLFAMSMQPRQADMAVLELSTFQNDDAGVRVTF